MAGDQNWTIRLEKPIDATSLFQLEIPPQEMVVDGMFAVGQCGHLYSGTGKGKSLNAQILGMCIATGKPFGSFKVPKARKVLYCDGEMHPSEWQQRLLRMDLTDKDFEKLIQNYYYWNGLHGKGFPDLSNPKSYKEFFLFCTENQIDVAIIDNYFCMTRMKDYNSPQEVQQLEDNFVKEAKKWDIAILFIDHTNKGGSNYGTIVKLGFAEFGIKVDYDKEPKIFTMSLEKGRSLNSSFDDMVYRISTEDNSIQVLDIASAKDKNEAKAIEKNRVGNIFKDMYVSGCNRSQTLKDAIKKYKETLKGEDMQYQFETLRTFIALWVADLGINDDETINTDISVHQS
tara:strand:- start:68 stop:1096 length:1029 start_codon:yes stop_codon:yes gene_type:complete